MPQAQGKQQEFPALTAREQDVLACLLFERTSKKIALILEMQPRTVEKHIENIMIKLDRHSRESLMALIERQEGNDQLKEHYGELVMRFQCHKEMKTIAQQKILKGIRCYIQCKNIPVKERLMSDLKKVGVFCSGTESSAVKIHVRMPKEFTKKATHVILYQENYYHLFFELLAYLKPHPLIKDARQHFTELFSSTQSVGNPTSQNFRNELTSTPVSLSNVGLFPLSSHFVRKILKYVCAILVFFVPIFGGILFFQVVREDIIQSDLATLVETKTLYRDHLIRRIDQAYAHNKEAIKITALVGMGGAGKTTLARRYAKQQKASVIWEMNAETKNTLLDSFVGLAYAFAKTDSDAKELECIKKIDNFDNYIKKLLLFVKSRLKKLNAWFLVFDNVENIIDIQAFIPNNTTTWGKGKILMTTRNPRIQENQQIGVQQVIPIDELNSEEQMELFTKIMAKKLTPQEKRIVTVFLKHLPPFPLDISVAAEYIKTTGIPYSDYLNNLERIRDDFEKSQSTVLKDFTTYDKTRYGIISCAIQDLLKKQPEFLPFLFLISFLDSQNIPKTLLEQNGKQGLVDLFLMRMAQHSLLKANGAVFSIHRSTQQNSRLYLERTVTAPQKKIACNQILEVLENHVRPLVEKIEIFRLRTLLPHLYACFTNRSFFDSEQQARVELLVASVLCTVSDLLKAQQVITLSLNTFETTPNYEQNPNYVRALIYAGIIERNLESHVKAEQFLAKGIRLSQNGTLITPSEFAMALCYLGYVYKITRNFNDAKKTVEKGIALYEKLGNNKFRLAIALSDLATIYYSRGYYESALRYHSEALKIFKAIAPADHVRIFITEGLLGMDYRESGHYQKALVYFEKSYSHMKQHYPENSDCSWLAINLGKTYRVYGDYKKAEMFLTEGVRLSQKKFGLNHLFGCWGSNALARFYCDIGKYDQACQILERNRAICGKQYNEQHEKIAQILQCLGIAYTHLKRFKDAESCFSKSLKFYERRYGKNHPNYALALKDFGWFCGCIGSYDNAEKVLNQALVILQKTHDPECYSCLEFLGDLYLMRSKTETHDLALSFSYKKQALFQLNCALICAKNIFPQNASHVVRIEQKIKMNK